MNDKLHIVFVADIFGITHEFKSLCQEITSGIEQTLSVECQMIGPYQKQPKSFDSEQAAYQYFTEQVGLADYVKMIAQQLSLISGNKLLVGFSVGGSAIWQLCSNNMVDKNLGAICFYSSQIRHMTQLTPKIATRLILPASERHFSITELQNALQDKSTVTIEKSAFSHGFMNQLSMNYDSDGCQYYVKRLVALASQLKPKPVFSSMSVYIT